MRALHLAVVLAVVLVAVVLVASVVLAAVVELLTIVLRTPAGSAIPLCRPLDVAVLRLATT